MMTSLVAQPAPEFDAEAVMADGTFGSVKLSDYQGKKYVVLFFYPLDFTFVCPTEIIAFSEAASRFEELGVQLLSCSIDSKFTHLAWREKSRDEGGLGKVDFPMLADINKQIATDYGVLLNGAVSLRGLFLIDKEGVVRHAVVNDLPLGRNVEEAIRMVEALQYFEENGEVCPANWQKGSSTIKPDVDGSREFFRKEYAQAP